MNRRMEPRLFWLIIFVISISVVTLIYSFDTFNINKQVEINTQAINETEVNQKLHDKQTQFIGNRQSIIMQIVNANSHKLEHNQEAIMTIVNGDVAYLKNKFEADLNYDKMMNEKLNILLAQNKT